MWIGKSYIEEGDNDSEVTSSTGRVKAQALPKGPNSFNTSFSQLSCHDDERLALLQFKQSFVIEKLASSYEGAYPKVLSWKAQGGSSNCCSWDGVECDEKTGHVIGLILNSSCLYGSINSSSSLFHLVHLQKLNLADNNFSYSLIPSAIGQFLGLTYLNLSDSWFYGQIPSEISHLSKLTFLDLSSHFNEIDPSNPLLELKNPSLRSLVQNLTSLEWLRLSSVHIPSTVHDFLANFTSLKAIILQNCGLYGEFPNNIFHLPNLKILALGWNKDLTGYLPEFHQRSPLEGLVLSETSFSGCIPPSIEKLESLEGLYLRGCNFSRPLPSSLGKLSKLIDLDLRANHLGGPIPSWLGNLSQLVRLYLDNNNLDGYIPSFQNLSQLGLLSLRDNHLTGPIPSSFGNLTQLFAVYLEGLGLGSCNLSEFPNFLRHQNKLELLDLSRNKIHGHIPKWMWNTSLETLTFLLLDHNFLVDFPHPSPIFLPWVNLLALDLSFNLLQGQLPIAPTSVQYYSISNNWLTGKIFSWMCDLSSVWLLDLSSNNLSGTVPQCLGKLSSLSVLNLENNSFGGTIPQVCALPSNLKIDLSKNKFKGQLARSMAACTKLEYFDVEKNQLTDIFPAWLGTLPELKVLSLRHNRFYGFIKKPKQKLLFPKLRVMDLSYNYFTGKLPFHYVLIWSGMKVINNTDSRYMKETKISQPTRTYASQPFDYRYSTTIVNKGQERYYEVISENFAEIDFSCNKFNGEIPQLIGNLIALRSLNLSFNNLTGSIPSSLGNLKELESLDLSNNKLSGEIPPQLTRLTFIQSFDVSRNNLRGPIPQANQFGNMDNTSFEAGLSLELLLATW
ncbi:receptor-like protein Cf-9 [Morus notabilis]|uniref:receptor-like protein Cf-9 n=1 Tax=Morus notabilis TaxID=981085 RepID=UPI000CED442E|nr:receptor-like protein Cf-9 [Morus notabilis]